MDAYSAVVTVETAVGIYQKRVGSAGEIHSKSLLNAVHFGLGKAADKSTLAEWGRKGVDGIEGEWIV